jgi:hypothetical protein
VPVVDAGLHLINPGVLMDRYANRDEWRRARRVCLFTIEAYLSDLAWLGDGVGELSDPIAEPSVDSSSRR